MLPDAIGWQSWMDADGEYDEAERRRKDQEDAEEYERLIRRAELGMTDAEVELLGALYGRGLEENRGRELTAREQATKRSGLKKLVQAGELNEELL